MPSSAGYANGFLRDTRNVRFLENLGWLGERMHKGGLDVCHNNVAMSGGMYIVQHSRTIHHEVLEGTGFGEIIEAFRVIFNDAAFS